MIEQIINSIVEAEKASEAKIAQAQIQADKLLLDSENKIMRIKEQASAERKQRVKERAALADRLASESADMERKEGYAACDKQHRDFSKNKSKAIDYIIGSVI